MPGLKEIYLDLRDLALNTVVYKDTSGQDVKILTSEYWNEQYIEQETGEERAYPYPALFIEFPEEEEYESIGRGAVQTENLTIRLHFVMAYFKPYSPSVHTNLEIFDARVAIIKAFNRFFPPSGAAQNELTFITERKNPNNNNLWIWEFDFECWYREDAAFEDQDQVQVTGVELKTEVIPKITNYDIRTAAENDL